MSAFVNNTFQSAAVATGNGTVANCLGCSTFGVQVVGITTATITFEITNDGTNWVAVVAKNMNSGAEATTATADGFYQVPVAGAYQLRCRISAWTSGTITVTGMGIVGGVSMPNTTVAAVVGSVDTELPTAAALNGTWAKTTSAPIVGAAPLLNDGTNLIQAVGGAGAVSSAVARVTLASDDPAVASLGVIDDWDNGASDGASVSGDVAHDSPDAGEPVKVGGKALTANPTAVAANDRVNAMFDKLGKQVTVGGLRELKAVQKTTITASTSETTIVTAVASTFLDLYGLIIANTSATICDVTIKDATAGTTRAILTIPADETRGFMLPMDSAVPQAAVNNNWTATCSASVTSIEITALTVQNL